MTFAAAFPRTFSAPFKPDLAADVVASWWVVPGKTCVAAYQPKGAASLAASYVNLANPGTYDAAPGVAPTLTADGWTFDGATQYLTTGIVQANQSWTFIVRYSSVFASNGPTLIGAYSTGFRSEIHPYWFADSVLYSNGHYYSTTPSLLSGTYAMAGITAYRNGIADGTVAENTNIQTQAFEIGNLGGSRDGAFALNGNIQAIAIYSATLTAGEVAAVSAVMAAL